MTLRVADVDDEQKFFTAEFIILKRALMKRGRYDFIFWVDDDGTITKGQVADTLEGMHVDFDVAEFLSQLDTLSIEDVVSTLQWTWDQDNDED